MGDADRHGSVLYLSSGGKPAPRTTTINQLDSPPKCTDQSELLAPIPTTHDSTRLAGKWYVPVR